MSVTEAGASPQRQEASQEPGVYRRSLGDRLKGGATTASLVGALGLGAFLGYNHMNGPVGSNHRDHQAKIEQYDKCEIYVNMNDQNGDGIAQVKLQDMTEAELKSCGFGDIYDQTTKALNHVDHEAGVLDGGVTGEYSLDATVQLPSRQALEQAVKDEQTASLSYARSVRGEGIILGTFGGGVAWVLGAVGIIYVGFRRHDKREFTQEVDAGPHDWINQPPTKTVYDWSAEHAS